MKLCQLKARLSVVEYRELKTCADAAGLSISEYVRTVLARERQALGIEDVLSEFRTMLAVPKAESTPSHPGRPDPLLVEAVLLLRELVAERNPQLLGRVASKLDATFGRERGRV